MESIFSRESIAAYPYRYHLELVVHELHGGFPQNQDVALDHLRRKLADRDDLLRKAVSDLMVDKALAGEKADMDEAAAEVALAKNLNGFRRDDRGLYIEGRTLKSCLKEAASIAVNAGRIDLKGWGITHKWLTKWLPEHMFVDEEKLHLGRTEPDGIAQRFVVTRHGTGIQLEEYVIDAKVEATIVTDVEIKRKDWVTLWTTAEKNGLGASRSQGYGTFAVSAWEPIGER